MSTPPPDPLSLSCPIPIDQYPAVTMAHGGGGRLTAQLIDRLFAPLFQGANAGPLHDGAVIEGLGAARLAVSTDSYVVRPLFFPGGDIGKLAVCGTINDVAMCGARPLWMTVGFVLEEGLPMETLWQIVCSMADTAREAGVRIVAGDTKVVDRGKCDGMYINTTGFGGVPPDIAISPASVRPGDAVLLSGDVGRHGMAILAARGELQLESALESDCAPLHGAVQALINERIAIHCLRDCTRGGLATAVVEIARAAGARVELDEAAIPVAEEVQGLCEILGFDPLFVANEGRFLAFVKKKDAERALEILRAQPVSAGATRIGRVADQNDGMATLKSRIGATRILNLLSGEQLPRIC